MAAVAHLGTLGTFGILFSMVLGMIVPNLISVAIITVTLSNSSGAEIYGAVERHYRAVEKQNTVSRG